MKEPINDFMRFISKAESIITQREYIKNMEVATITDGHFMARIPYGLYIKAFNSKDAIKFPEHALGESCNYNRTTKHASKGSLYNFDNVISINRDGLHPVKNTKTIIDGGDGQYLRVLKNTDTDELIALNDAIFCAVYDNFPGLEMKGSRPNCAIFFESDSSQIWFMLLPIHCDVKYHFDNI